VVFKEENEPEKSFITMEEKSIGEKLDELQPWHPLPVKEKGDISIALSSEAPLAAQCCNRMTSFLQI
jgi:hypothetical protein